MLDDDSVVEEESVKGGAREGNGAEGGESREDVERLRKKVERMIRIKEQRGDTEVDSEVEREMEKM